jgi:hypothetical protein
VLLLVVVLQGPMLEAKKADRAFSCIEPIWKRYSAALRGTISRHQRLAEAEASLDAHQRAFS